MTDEELEQFKKEAKAKQLAYTKKRSRWYKLTNNRAIMKDGENKPGKPR